MPDAVLSQMIFESMTDGVVCLDAKGLITDLNPAAAEILGLARDQARGLAYPEVFFQAEANDALNQMVLDLVISREKRPYEELPFERPDGEVRHLALTTSLLTAPDGAYQGAVLVFKDITKVVRLRDQRDKLAAELAEKHESLRKAYIELDEHNQDLSEKQKRLFWIKITAGACGLLLFAGIAWVAAGSLDNSGSGLSPSLALRPLDAESTDLREAKAHVGDVSVSVASSGILEPVQTISVGAMVGGRVVKKNVSLGQRVKKGDLLYELSQAEVMPKVRQAQVQMLNAREKLNELSNWSERPETMQAQRALELAKMDLEQKKDRLEESEQLFKEGIIPENDLVSARSEMVRAQSGLADAQERLRTARERGSKDKMQVARLEFENAKAAYEDAVQMVKDTQVLAPVDGVVMRPETQANDEVRQSDLPQQGAIVQQGQGLLTLGMDRNLGVLAQVSEVDIAKITVGLPVVVRSMGAGGAALPGRVVAVEPQAKATRSGSVFPITIALDEMDQALRDRLRLGMSASVRVITAQAKDAVLVPVLAVSRRPEGPSVLVKDGQAYRWQPVTLGISDDEFVQVKEGLKPHDTVYF